MLGAQRWGASEHACTHASLIPRQYLEPVTTVTTIDIAFYAWKDSNFKARFLSFFFVAFVLLFRYPIFVLFFLLVLFYLYFFFFDIHINSYQHFSIQPRPRGFSLKTFFQGKALGTRLIAIRTRFRTRHPQVSSTTFTDTIARWDSKRQKLF